MNEEEKFDELLRSRLSERDFPFNESGWEDAERLIDRREKREKGARFLLIFAAGVVAGTLIMLPFMLNTHTASPGAVAVHSISGQNTIGTTNSQPVTNPSAGSVDNTIQKEQKTATSVSENDNRAGVQPSAFVKKDDTPTGTQSTPAVTSATQRHTAVSPAHIRNRSITSPAKSNTFASASNSNLLPVNQEDHQPSSSSATVSDKNNDNNEPGNASVAVNPSSSVAANPSSSQADNKSSATNNPPAPGSNNQIAQSNTATANNNVQQSSHDTSAKNAAPAIAAVNNNTSLPEKGDNGVRYPDTAHYTSNNDLSSVIFPNIFSVYAGGTYSLGWQGPDLAKSVKQANGLTPWAGLNFTHYFTPRISASLGIGYAELSGLSSQYSSSVLQYDFGTNEKITAVTPQLVYYMAFPFKVQYDIDSKDLFGIGCNYLLMMTTYSTLVTSRQTDFVTTSSTSEKQNGYTQGFSNTDWQLTFSYTRMFMNRLGVGIEYFRDLDYIENNTISNLSQSAKNNGFRLIISYQLLK